MERRPPSLPPSAPSTPAGRLHVASRYPELFSAARKNVVLARARARVVTRGRREKWRETARYRDGFSVSAVRSRGKAHAARACGERGVIESSIGDENARSRGTRGARGAGIEMKKNWRAKMADQLRVNRRVLFLARRMAARVVVVIVTVVIWDFRDRPRRRDTSRRRAKNGGGTPRRAPRRVRPAPRAATRSAGEIHK